MVDEREVAAWEKEAIPDICQLFMRIHKNWLENGEPIPGAFRNQKGGMSTGWGKYSDPQDTRKRGKVPEENGVIQLNVGETRQVPGQTVEHKPDHERSNRAHTEVLGEKNKDPEVRLKFLRIFKWSIRPEISLDAPCPKLLFISRKST